MTRKELKAFVSTCANVKKGYCCLQDDGHNKYEETIKKIGTNCGVYGWNWTLYYNTATDTAYIDGYRNY